MNVPTRVALDSILATVGSDTTLLGNGSIGLIAAAFTPGPALTLASLTEANFSGYARKALGTTTTTFTGGDGLEYVEFNTAQWIPSSTTTVNTIYGAFLTNGNSTTSLFTSDSFTTPLPMAGPSNQITITPRVGLDPSGNFGLNIVSN